MQAVPVCIEGPLKYKNNANMIVTNSWTWIALKWNAVDVPTSKVTKSFISMVSRNKQP